MVYMRKSWVWHSGSFGAKTEDHGREPTSRGRYEGQAARATREGMPKETCHTTKRTHRFTLGFLMQWSLCKEFVRKCYGEFGGFVSGKRTHRRGVSGGKRDAERDYAQLMETWAREVRGRAPKAFGVKVRRT